MQDGALEVNPLGDFRVSFLGEWRAGQTLTWTGGGSDPNINNNVRYRDYWNFDLRFTKNFNTRAGDLQFFADMGIRAFQMLPSLDNDARYDMGRIAEAAGNATLAKAQSNSLQARSIASSSALSTSSQPP